MVQQVQLVQPKSEQQVVQIPSQALKVVQAASATLPPVPQRIPATPSVQVAPPEPTQVCLMYLFLLFFCYKCFHIIIMKYLFLSAPDKYLNTSLSVLKTYERYEFL